MPKIIKTGMKKRTCRMKRRYEEKQKKNEKRQNKLKIYIKITQFARHDEIISFCFF